PRSSARGRGSPTRLLLKADGFEGFVTVGVAFHLCHLALAKPRHGDPTEVKRRAGASARRNEGQTSNDEIIALSDDGLDLALPALRERLSHIVQPLQAPRRAVVSLVSHSGYDVLDGELGREQRGDHRFVDLRSVGHAHDSTEQLDVRLRHAYPLRPRSARARSRSKYLTILVTRPCLMWTISAPRVQDASSPSPLVFPRRSNRRSTRTRSSSSSRYSSITSCRSFQGLRISRTPVATSVSPVNVPGLGPSITTYSICGSAQSARLKSPRSKSAKIERTRSRLEDTATLQDPLL